MLGWRPLVVSWINTVPAGLTDMHKKMITDMFYRMLPASLEFIRKSGVKVGLALLQAFYYFVQIASQGNELGEGMEDKEKGMKT